MRTRDVNRVAEQYFNGLIQASKKNMERMAETVPDCDDQSLQHFLTNSPWDDQRVVEQVAHDVNTIVGGRKNSCLILDESGMPKRVDILHHRVWLWDGVKPKAHCWYLVVRRELCTNDVKYSLSNAPASTSFKRLAFMQAQRYWIERKFQDAKTQCGMGEYQARKWQSWHNHMAMVMMAILFMVEQRMLLKNTYPLLSCFDIVCIPKFLLPQRAVTLAEVVRQLEVRHKRRQAAIDYAYQKQLELEFSENNVIVNVTK